MTVFTEDQRADLHAIVEGRRGFKEEIHKAMTHLAKAVRNPSLAPIPGDPDELMRSLYTPAWLLGIFVREGGFEHLEDQLSDFLHRGSLATAYKKNVVLVSNKARAKASQILGAVSADAAKLDDVYYNRREPDAQDEARFVKVAKALAAAAKAIIAGAQDPTPPVAQMKKRIDAAARVILKAAKAFIAKKKKEGVPDWKKRQESVELGEAFLRRPPKYPKPYTEKHMRQILVDAQMRLSGALTLGYGLVHDNEWDEEDRERFDDKLSDIIADLQSLYSHMGT